MASVSPAISAPLPAPHTIACLPQQSQGPFVAPEARDAGSAVPLDGAMVAPSQ